MLDFNLIIFIEVYLLPILLLSKFVYSVLIKTVSGMFDLGMKKLVMEGRVRLG